MFILLVLAYFVIRFDVSVFEKLTLTTLVAICALIPFALPALPNLHLAAAICQGIIGVYNVVRMHYLRAAH